MKKKNKKKVLHAHLLFLYLLFACTFRQSKNNNNNTDIQTFEKDLCVDGYGFASCAINKKKKKRQSVFNVLCACVEGLLSHQFSAKCCASWRNCRASRTVTSRSREKQS